MPRIFILFLCLVGLVVYFNSLNNNFVFDDKALIISNPLVRSAKSCPLAFRSGIYDHWIGIPLYDRMYRPLQIISYATDYKIWGLSPFGFHFTNFLFHLLNAILVYYLLLALFHKTRLSLIVSLFFLVHPIQVSVVSYIAGRADLLSSFFMLLGIIAFAKFIEKNELRYYGFSLVVATFALFSRENALLLFIFMAIVLYIRNSRRRYYLFLVPFILLDLAYLVLRVYIFGYRGLYMHPDFLSPPLQLINFFNIFLKYILLLIFPFNLHLLRVTPFIKNFLEPKAIYSLFVIALYLFAIFRFRKNKLVVFGLLWFLIGLIPVFFYLDGFPLFEQAMMAESWSYLAGIGFFIILVYILNSIKSVGKIITIALIILFGFLTMLNNSYWRNNLILYKRTLQFTPGRNPVRKLLIDEYLLSGQYQEAFSEIKNLSLYYPDSKLLDLAWGNYYSFTRQPELAREKYEKAKLKDKPFFCIVE